jgi:peptidoglycan/LPS O-acetylase OafA/YrhL
VPGNKVIARAVTGFMHRDSVPALTGLRFVAAFCVLIAHSVTVLMIGHDVYWIKQASGFGMTLFFVLSGFVVHYNYAATVTGAHAARGMGAFFWARFTRLYPLLLLVLALSVLVIDRRFEFWTGHVDRFIDVLRVLPYYLLSVQNWIYLPIGDTSLIYAIGPSASLTWSISTEWFFYLVYPVAAWVIIGLRAPRAVAVVLVAWCALWIFVATSLHDRSPELETWAVAHFGEVASAEQHPLNSFVRWLLYFSPYLRIGEFVLGALVAQFYVQLQPRKAVAAENVFGNAVFMAAAASMIVISYFSYAPGMAVNVFRKMDTNSALASSAGLLIFCAARYRSVVLRALNAAVANALGNASYSIYLLHIGVLMAATWLTGIGGHSLGFDGVRLVVTDAGIILLSLLVYRFYEAPTQKWLRRFDARDRPAPAPAKPSLEY